MRSKFSNYKVGGYQLIQELLADLDDNPLRPWSAYPCLEWPRGRTTHGYGSLYYLGTTRKAHRVAFELVNGPLSDLDDICHHCDNPPCIRPIHLFVGDAKSNAADMVRKGRARNGMLKGSRNGASKLSEVDVERIRVLRLSGTRLKVIASQFGVSETMISYIARRKNWAHL